MRHTFHLLPILAVIGCAHPLKHVAKHDSKLWDEVRDPFVNDILGECGYVRIQFAYNSAELTEHDRGLLECSAWHMKDNPFVNVVVEGHTDERGTEEFNLVLSEKRTQSVAGYLKMLGADDAQVKMASYGELSPVCEAHDETCWARNRRATLKQQLPPGPPILPGLPGLIDRSMK